MSLARSCSVLFFCKHATLILTLSLSISASESSRASERVVEILQPKPGEQHTGSVHFRIYNPYHDGQHGFLSPSLVVYGRTFDIRILIDGGEFDLRRYIQSLGRGAGRRNKTAEDCEQTHAAPRGSEGGGIFISGLSRIFFLHCEEEREDEKERGEQVEEQEGRAQQAVKKECKHQQHLFNESEVLPVFVLTFRAPILQTGHMLPPYPNFSLSETEEDG
eukprot:44401-Hanusia_phi.AAC.1